MSHLRSRRTGTAALVAALASLVALMGVASSASAATIYACQKKKGGTIRIVSSKTKCKKSEKKIKWSTTGPAGKNGTNGAAGTNGTNGAAGSNGAAGAPGAAGQPQQAISFDLTRDTSATKSTLFTAGGATVKLNCIFFLANFAGIQVTGTSGTLQSGAVYTDAANAPPAIAQTYIFSDVVDATDNNVSLLSSNTSGELTNKGHVNATIKTATHVIFMDYFVQAAPSPAACTVRGHALVIPV